ncbi:MAG TPA: SDR family oxidoreductase [Limnochordia bacterium]
MQQELVGKCALVTGSSGGLGKHIALALARAGAAVAINYRTNRAAAEALAARIEAEGGRAAVLGGDVTEPADCRRLVDETVARLGAIDILVNNAGEYSPALCRDHTDVEFERIVRSTVGGTFYCSMRALEYMRPRRWGRIVNLGAAGAERAAGRRNIGPHLAGKSAVISLTRTLAVEEGPFGVTVNAICPGVIEDREISREEAAHLRDRWAPVGRPGTHEDIDDAVLFLVSPRASFINGAVLQVTGGYGL